MIGKFWPGSRSWISGAMILSVATAAMVLATGCSPKAGSVVPANVANIVLRGGNQTQDEAVYDALQLATKKCMTKKGLPYRAGPWDAGATESEAPFYVNEAILTRNGYGLRKPITQSQGNSGPDGPSKDPNAAYLRSLNSVQAQRWNDALSSGPEMSLTTPDGTELTYQPGGCTAEAYDEVYGSYAEWLDMHVYAQDLRTKVNTEALWSKLWKSAQARWAHCMAGHGFHYSSEAAAVYDVTMWYQASATSRSRVRQFELRVARQDAACRAAVRLNQAGLNAIRETSASLPGDQASAMLTWQQMQARAFTAASRILAAARMPTPDTDDPHADFR